MVFAVNIYNGCIVFNGLYLIVIRPINNFKRNQRSDPIQHHRCRCTRDFSVIWRRHHYRWLAANFHLCSAFKQWGFLTCHPTLTQDIRLNGYLREPVTLTPIAERLAVELSLPVFIDSGCRAWDSNTQPSACEAIALTDCATTICAMFWCLHITDVINQNFLQ